LLTCATALGVDFSLSPAGGALAFGASTASGMAASPARYAAGPHAMTGAAANRPTNTFESHTMPSVAPELLDALFTSGPHPSLGKHAETYGRLIGSWAGEFNDRLPNGKQETGAMEVHFGWVLQGLAIQDVWIAPSRTARKAGATASRDTYGTTLRIFQRDIEAWHVLWFNPVRNVRNELLGKRVGDDIVQLGLDANSAPTKWVFTNITPNSFVWQAHVLDADGVTWRLGTDFNFKRTA
jgi:hypothetical protein